LYEQFILRQELRINRISFLYVVNGKIGVSSKFVAVAFVTKVIRYVALTYRFLSTISFPDGLTKNSSSKFEFYSRFAFNHNKKLSDFDNQEESEII